MTSSEADGLSEFRVYCGDPEVNEGLAKEKTCKNVVQLG